MPKNGSFLGKEHNFFKEYGNNHYLYVIVVLPDLMPIEDVGWVDSCSKLIKQYSKSIE